MNIFLQENCGKRLFSFIFRLLLIVSLVLAVGNKFETLLRENSDFHKTSGSTIIENENIRWKREKQTIWTYEGLYYRTTKTTNLARQNVFGTDGYSSQFLLTYIL